MTCDLGPLFISSLAIYSIYMEHFEGYFFDYNKSLDDRLDEVIHNLERRIDRLLTKKTNLFYYGSKINNIITDLNSQSCSTASSSSPNHTTASKCQLRITNPLSTATYSQFGYPYIRDFRKFSAPINEDVKQIRDLIGGANINNLIENKAWTRETKEQLKAAILDHYAQAHIVRLMKQKDELFKNQAQSGSSKANNSQHEDEHEDDDLEQKLKLIDEQTEQVKARKNSRIFVPEDRLDSHGIDWCSISAKLTKTQHDVQDCKLMWQNELHWSINNSFWSKEEDECLLDAVQKHGKNDWDAVSKELNSNRLPWQCCSRFQQEFSKPGSTQISQEDTDKILEVINLCKIGNFVPWNQVMYFIRYYNLSQVKYQWNKLISGRGSGQSWSTEEDLRLLKYVEKFGIKDWNRISSYMQDRSNRSCRERYMMRLKFEKRALGKWNLKEDSKLIAYVNRFGTHWGTVSNHFPERNQHQLRNRYELLKNERGRLRRATIKQSKLVRNDEGLAIKYRKRMKKPESEKEIDQTLLEIFSSYQNVRTTQKSLICRTGVDETIYQVLCKSLCSFLTGIELSDGTLLETVIHRALELKVFLETDILSPCNSTIQGYKAWSAQQGYFAKICGTTEVNIEEYCSSQEYLQVKNIALSLFIWPSLLARLKPPLVNCQDFLQNSIIERDTNSLFKVRALQKHIVNTLY